MSAVTFAVSVVTSFESVDACAVASAAALVASAAARSAFNSFCLDSSFSEELEPLLFASRS